MKFVLTRNDDDNFREYLEVKPVFNKDQILTDESIYSALCEALEKLGYNLGVAGDASRYRIDEIDRV